MLARNRKFTDSPLEGAGFEISVPRRSGSLPKAGSHPSEVLRLGLEPLIAFGQYEPPPRAAVQEPCAGVVAPVEWL
jgi:hypothetical protein